MVGSGLLLHIPKTRMRGGENRREKSEKLCKSHETKQYIELVENDGIQNRAETISVQYKKKHSVYTCAKRNKIRNWVCRKCHSHLGKITFSARTNLYSYRII